MNSKWERRFLEMAKLVSTWSKDPGTQVGAVIVRPNRTVVSIGYNGYPRAMPDVPPADRDDKLSRTIHAEINALLTARVDVTGCAIFIYPLLSCDRCFVQLVQAGIKEFIAPIATGNLRQRWRESIEKVYKYADEIHRSDSWNDVLVREVLFD